MRKLPKSAETRDRSDSSDGATATIDHDKPIHIEDIGEPLLRGTEATDQGIIHHLTAAEMGGERLLDAAIARAQHQQADGRLFPSAR